VRSGFGFGSGGEGSVFTCVGKVTYGSLVLDVVFVSGERGG